jgi:NAD(P)-dependent dehydrogenase (short-subunit alcohol dehydrogenase family)
VVVSARRRAELHTLVVEIEEAGGDAVAVAGDVRDEALAEALVETAVGHFGRLDVAFNNAGSTGQMAPVPELSLATGATRLTPISPAPFSAPNIRRPR